MYICGDYNINLLNNTVLSNSFKNILIQLGISNIIDMPTRITQNSQSSLDNIFTNCLYVIRGIIYISDHSLIFCIFNYNLFVKRKDQYTYSQNINELNLHNLQYIGIPFEVWSNTYKSNITKLIMLQKKVISIINKQIIDKSKLPLIRLHILTHTGPF